MPQNNHLIEVWVSGSFIDQKEKQCETKVKIQNREGKKGDAFIPQILLFPTGASTPGEDTEKASLNSVYLIQRK